MPFVKKGTIESLKSEEKVARDASSPKKRAKSKKSKNAEDVDTFPLHHYTKDIIADGEFDNSFEEWIFDPIISSNYQQRELMIKARKEKAAKEAKLKKLEEKIKTTKPSDTFYLLNKKRLNLEPVPIKSTSSNNLPPSKPKAKMKSVSTFTETNFVQENQPENTIQDSLKTVDPQMLKVAEPRPVETSPPRMNYMEGMDDIDSKYSSNVQPEKKKMNSMLQLSDTIELYKDYTKLSADVSLVKKITTTNEVRGEVIERGAVGSVAPPPPPANRTSQTPSEAKTSPPVSKSMTPKQEEFPKLLPKDKETAPQKDNDDMDSKENKLEESLPANTGKEELKPEAKPPQEKTEVKEDGKKSEVMSKFEPKKDTPPNPVQKPAPSMGRIPLPPGKKPADAKPAEKPKETKLQPTPSPFKKTEPTQSSKPAEEEKKPDEPKRDEEDLPKFSNNPFLAKQALAKSPPPVLKTAKPAGSPSPDKKESAKPTPAKPVLQSPSKPQSQDPPKSPQNDESEKISGLRSIWK